MDRMAGGAAAARAAGIDARARELARDVLFYQYLQWLAGDAVAGGARAGRAGVALFGDLPFMVDGDSADVWARQHQFRLDVAIGAPPDAFSATGQDWGMPLYRWDVHGRRKTSGGCASARGGPPICSTATASITSSASTARTARPKTAASRFSRRRTKRRRSRSASGCSGLPRAQARRSSPRTSARCPTSFAHRSRAWACPVSACFAGSATGTRRGSRSATRGVSRASRSPRPARTTPSRWSSWWERASGRAIARGEPPADDPALSRRRGILARPSTRRSATCCSRRCSRRGRICCCCPCRTCSAGAIASTSRRRSPTTTGRIRLPWPIDQLDDVPEARERQGQLRAWSGNTDDS